jgi:hypothetical protein
MTTKPEEDGGEPETAHEPGAEAPPPRLSCTILARRSQLFAGSSRNGRMLWETGQIVTLQQRLAFHAGLRDLNGSSQFSVFPPLLQRRTIPPRVPHSSVSTSIYESWIKPPLLRCPCQSGPGESDGPQTILLWRCFDILRLWTIARNGGVEVGLAFLTSPMRVSAVLCPVSLVPNGPR